LHQLGDRDQGKALLARHAAQLKPGEELSWFEDLIDAEYRVGLKEEAFAHAVVLLGGSRDQGWPTRLLPKLFPGRGDRAEALWRLLRYVGTDENVDGSMRRLRRLLEAKLDVKEVRELVRLEANREWQQSPPPDDLAAERLALAEVALAAG